MTQTLLKPISLLVVLSLLAAGIIVYCVKIMSPEHSTSEAWPEPPGASRQLSVLHAPSVLAAKDPPAPAPLQQPVQQIVLPPPAIAPVVKKAAVQMPADPWINRLVNRDLKDNERISGDISAKIPRVKNPEDYPALLDVLEDPSDNDAVRNEVANLLGRSAYPRFSEVLFGILDNPHEKARFRAFATQHLGQRLDNADSETNTAVRNKLFALLTDRNEEVSREALLALTRKKDPKAVHLAMSWLHDTSEDADFMRDLAIRCACEMDLRDEMQTIRQYTNSPHESIRIAAIVTLSQWKDEASRAAFQEAANSKSLRLHRAGQAALERLDAKSASPVSK